MYFLLTLILLLEVLGYSALICIYARIQGCFALVIATTCMTLFVFLGGIADVLDISVIVVHVGGCVAFGYSVLVKAVRRSISAFFKDPGVWFFTIGFMLFALLLPNATYAHYDDFSHWGTIVSDIFATHAFPKDGSTVGYIGNFVNYPPATASFIYYACSLIGYTEGHTIVAQNMLMLSGLASLFGCVRHSRPWSEVLLCSLLAMSSLFVIENGIAFFQTLLTDVVMGTVVVAAFLIMVYGQGSTFRLVLLSLPVILVAAFVKDNGKLYFALFALFALSELILQSRSRVKRQKWTAPLLKALLCTMIMFGAFAAFQLLWNAYVNDAYVAGFESGKFAVSFEKLAAEPQTSVFEICRRVLYEAFFFKAQRAIIFWGLECVAVALLIAAKRHGRSWSNLLRLTIAGNCAILVTCGALIVLYAYFMPLGESNLELAGFRRYYGTSLLIFYCLLSCGILDWIYRSRQGSVSGKGLVNESKAKRSRAISSVVFGLMLALMGFNGFKTFVVGEGLERMSSSTIVSAPTYSALREPVSSVLNHESNPIPPGSKVTVFFGDNAKGSFSYYVSLYESHDEVMPIDSLTDPQTALSVIAQSDWMVFVGDDESEFVAYLDGIGLNIPEMRDDCYFVVRHYENGAIAVKPFVETGS